MTQTSEELLEELGFPPAQGKRSSALQVEVVRELREGDLGALQKPAAAPPALLTRIRHSHHMLAQGVAQGLDNGAIALSTGYDPAYISKLKGDPSFAELVEFYRAQQEQAFVDVMARMRQLGLSVVDELQHQFDEKPEAFTLREKMELCELMLVKSGHVGRGAQGAAAGAAGGPQFSLQVNFVAPPRAQALPGDGPIFEGEKVA